MCAGLRKEGCRRDFDSIWHITDNLFIPLYFVFYIFIYLFIQLLDIIAIIIYAPVSTRVYCLKINKMMING